MECAKGSDLALFFGDWSQIEKLSEIKLPLTVSSNSAPAVTVHTVQLMNVRNSVILCAQGVWNGNIGKTLAGLPTILMTL